MRVKGHRVDAVPTGDISNAVKVVIDGADTEVMIYRYSDGWRPRITGGQHGEVPMYRSLEDEEAVFPTQRRAVKESALLLLGIHDYYRTFVWGHNTRE